MRVVHVSGVRTSRVVTRRSGFPGDDLAARRPRGGLGSVEPARCADERRPDVGALRRSRRARRRRRRPRSRARAPPGRARPRRGAAGPRGRRLALVPGPRPCQRPPTETSNSTWLTSGRRREKLCTSGRPPLSRTVVRTTSRGEPATIRSRSASSGAAVPTSTTIRACARSAAYSRRRKSYSEPWLKSSSAARGNSAAGQEAVRDVVGLAVDAAQPFQFDHVVRAVQGQLDRHDGGGRHDPLGEHLGAHLGALLAHHRAEAGDAVHEALAVLVPDRRPGDVGAPALLTDEVAVRDQSVDRPPQGDPADPVLGAEHRLGREHGEFRQRGHAPSEMLADREVLRAGHGIDHAAKVRDRKTSGRHVV